MSWPLWQTEVPHPPHCPLLWTQLVAGLVVKCVKLFFHCVLSMGKLENENVMGEENINLPGIQFRSSGQGVFSAAWKTISSQVLHWSSCTRWVILQTSPCLQTWIVSQIVSRGNVCSPLPCKHCFLNQSKVWRIGCTRKGLCVCVCEVGWLDFPVWRSQALLNAMQIPSFCSWDISSQRSVCCSCFFFVNSWFSNSGRLPYFFCSTVVKVQWRNNTKTPWIFQIYRPLFVLSCFTILYRFTLRYLLLCCLVS